MILQGIYKVFHVVFKKCVCNICRGIVRYQDEYGKMEDFKSLMLTSGEFKWNLRIWFKFRTQKIEDSQESFLQTFNVPFQRV